MNHNVWCGLLVTFLRQQAHLPACGAYSVQRQPCLRRRITKTTDLQELVEKRAKVESEARDNVSRRIRGVICRMTIAADSVFH